MTGGGDWTLATRLWAKAFDESELPEAAYNLGVYFGHGVGMGQEGKGQVVAYRLSLNYTRTVTSTAHRYHTNIYHTHTTSTF